MFESMSQIYLLENNLMSKEQAGQTYFVLQKRLWKNSNNLDISWLEKSYVHSDVIIMFGSLLQKLDSKYV